MSTETIHQPKNIRNFAIISHIDHGKSTLADRFLELTGTIKSRDMHAQFLDRMELEREKGITIKLKTVRMTYLPRPPFLNFDFCIFNLTDTPGHVDFSYEVSRALAACEGVILLVDVSQGIQAQTLSVLQKARDLKLTIIPAINKVDLPESAPLIPPLEKEIRELLDGYQDEVSKISGKTGEGVEKLLHRIITEIPPPNFSPQAKGQRLEAKSVPPRALVFDSFFDPFKGVVALVRVFDGTINKNDQLTLLATKVRFEPIEIGFLKPGMVPQNQIETGEVGYIATGLKDISRVTVGDTVTATKPPIPQPSRLGVLNLEGYSLAASVQPLPGYKHPKPFVFLGFFPKDSSQLKELKEALEKLKLSDAALTVDPEHSDALGAGFRVGFLGLLHAEITSERLRREFEIDLVTTTPSVLYEIKLKNSERITARSPKDFPDPSFIDTIFEPKVLAKIFVPASYLGKITQLLSVSQAQFLETAYLGEKNLRVDAILPLSELMRGFYDSLKSVSSGFASLDYDFYAFEAADLVKIDIRLHGEPVEPLSQVVLRNKAYDYGKHLVERLKEVLPRQQFKVAIQACIGGVVVARETLPAYRKDVTAKLYGGDRTRRDKLLKKQAKGKKRMAAFGRVSLSPTQIFALLGQR